MQKLTPGTGRGSMTEFSQAQIDERKLEEASPHEPDGTGDFLSTYLALYRKEPDYFTYQDLFAGCITNISARSDTTSISLSSVLYNLCKYPEVLQKLREELEQKKAKGELSNPVTFKESQACPYLQAVIKEALRVHPATGLPLGRRVPKGGATIAGIFFPEGVCFFPYPLPLLTVEKNTDCPF
jgi:cytochrome P450